MMTDPELLALIERARTVEMTPEEQRLQRLDFAYGQLQLSTHHRTKLTFEEFCARYAHLA